MNNFYKDPTPGLTVDTHRQRPPANCIVCSNPLPVNRQWNQKTCSPTCRYKRHSQRTVNWRRKSQAGKLPTETEK